MYIKHYVLNEIMLEIVANNAVKISIVLLLTMIGYFIKDKKLAISWKYLPKTCCFWKLNDKLTKVIFSIVLTNTIGQYCVWVETMIMQQ